MEKDENGATTAVYTHEPGLHGELISQRRGENTSFYHYDGLGSTVALTNEPEEVTDTYLYDAWGNRLTHTGTTTNPFRWIGQVGYYFDSDLEAFYIRARVYDPKSGRWLSQDPLFYPVAYSDEYVAERMNRRNSFAYCDNNSMIRVDPFGLAYAPIYRSEVDGGTSVPTLSEKEKAHLKQFCTDDGCYASTKTGAHASAWVECDREDQMRVHINYKLARTERLRQCNLDHCIKVHEGQHIAHFREICPSVCECEDEGKGVGHNDKKCKVVLECYADATALPCWRERIEKLRKAGRTACVTVGEFKILEIEKRMKQRRCDRLGISIKPKSG